MKPDKLKHLFAAFLTNAGLCAVLLYFRVHHYAYIASIVTLFLWWFKDNVWDVFIRNKFDPADFYYDCVGIWIWTMVYLLIIVPWFASR